jgi:Zn finger protein HypA/HybF involved in hydrogenase expression
MKYVMYIIAGLLGFLGFIFIAGSQGQVMRVVVGVILMIAAGVMVYMTRMRPSETTLIQQIDLSGDVGVESIKCKSCGAPLDNQALSIQAGAVFVNCPYCGSVYQLEEQVKW